jgi:hypothetical protein
MWRLLLILTKFAHLVQRMDDMCGKLTKIHPWQHKAVRLACDRDVAGIYEARLRTCIETLQLVSGTPNEVNMTGHLQWSPKNQGST